MLVIVIIGVAIMKWAEMYFPILPIDDFNMPTVAAAS
jgi:hypothetical protein